MVSELEFEQLQIELNAARIKISELSNKLAGQKDQIKVALKGKTKDRHLVAQIVASAGGEVTVSKQLDEAEFYVECYPNDDGSLTYCVDLEDVDSYVTKTKSKKKKFGKVKVNPFVQIIQDAYVFEAPNAHLLNYKFDEWSDQYLAQVKPILETDAWNTIGVCDDDDRPSKEF